MNPAENIAKAVRRMVEDEIALGRRDGFYDFVIGAAEKPLLQSVMHQAGWNQAHAAKVLGINRNTLRTKLRAHGLEARRP